MSTALAPGNIYILCDCPAPRTHQVKIRPVLLVTPRDRLLDGSNPILVIGITSQPPSDIDAVQLPLDCGLSKASWAIPAWRILVMRSRLENCVGVVPKIIWQVAMDAARRHKHGCLEHQYKP